MTSDVTDRVFCLQLSELLETTVLSLRACDANEYRDITLKNSICAADMK